MNHQREKDCNNFYKNYKKLRMACRHSSVDSSVPSILPPRVPVRCTPSTFYQFIFELCHVEKDKSKQKRLGLVQLFFKKVRNLQLANAVLFDCAEDIFYAVEAYHYLPLCWIKYIILFSFQVGPKLFPIASHCLSVCLCVSLLWSSILSFSNITKSMSRLICFSFCLSHRQPADSIITKVVSLLICFSFRTMSVCPSQINITVYILYIYLRSYYLYTQSFKHRYVHLCLYCSNSRLI